MKLSAQFRILFKESDLTACHRKGKPLFTAYSVDLLATNSLISSERARCELSYSTRGKGLNPTEESSLWSLAEPASTCQGKWSRIVSCIEAVEATIVMVH